MSTSPPSRISRQHASEGLRRLLEASLTAGDHRLIDAIPGLGKSRGVVRAAAQTDIPITVLTGRGRREQYQQFEDWAEDADLRHYTLPAADRECGTFNGDYGANHAARVADLRDWGLSAGEIHSWGNLPCLEDGDCAYMLARDFDPAHYDVLIGHYLHAYVPEVRQDRVVVLDEFPGEAYLQTFENPTETITDFLSRVSIPYQDFDDLLRGRNDPDRRWKTLEWFRDRGMDLRDPERVIQAAGSAPHVHAPLLVLTILKAEDLGNGWDWAALGGGQTGVRSRETGSMTVAVPPRFSDAKGVVGLDGTPLLMMWEVATGLKLNHHRVLDNIERREYLRLAVGLEIIQTTGDVRPYSSGEHINEDRDEALLWQIQEEQGKAPDLISSKRAIDRYKDTSLQSLVNSTAYYGNLKGSNRFANAEVGVIIGSPHFGDEYVERWTALAGHPADREDTKGKSLDYGLEGNQVLHQMREASVFQAIMRFVRGSGGATVYVDTLAIPDWIPRTVVPGVRRKRASGERATIRGLQKLGSGSGTEVASRTPIGSSTVRKHLNKLVEEGVVAKEGATRSTQWVDTGLTSVNPFGVVELEGFAHRPYSGHSTGYARKVMADRWERHQRLWERSCRNRRRVRQQDIMESFRSEHRRSVA